jgi:ribonuclease Z
MMIAEAAYLARDAEVKQLWLTHYSPSLTHPEEYRTQADQIYPGTVFGKDGMSCELEFEDKEKGKS